MKPIQSINFQRYFAKAFTVVFYILAASILISTIAVAFQQIINGEEITLHRVDIDAILAVSDEKPSDHSIGEEFSTAPDKVKACTKASG